MKQVTTYSFQTAVKALQFYSVLKAFNMRGISDITLHDSYVWFQFNERANYATRNAIDRIRREVEEQ